MKKPIMALAAAGTLGLASVATPQSAHAMDPWTAAAWFVGGLFVGAAIAPAYGHAYGHPASYRYGYAPVHAAWGPQHCYATLIRRGNIWREARACY